MFNKSLVTFHKKIVFLLRKISKEALNFKPATVVLSSRPMGHLYTQSSEKFTSKIPKF